jgi:hypothetical protein
MEVEELTVDENDGTIQVKMVLDKPASVDLIIEYEIFGSAHEGSTATSDYEIQGDIGEVEIEAGATSGVIEIDINDDDLFEGDETIELSIQDANTDKVDLTNLDETEITIQDNEAQPEANFEVTALNKNEDDGMLELVVELSSPVGHDITLEYDLTGTAIDSLTAWDDEVNADYYIDGVSGELEIEAGETSATIRLQLYTDLLFEDGNGTAAGLGPETIILTLKPGSSGVEIGNDDVLQINLAQQDGRLIILDWAETSVDLDLFVWLGPDETDMGILAWSLFNQPEFAFIPKKLSTLFELPDALYGMSYLYYDGTVDPLDFQVTFIDVVSGAVEVEANRDVFDATYTIANKNKWPEESEDLPLILQTFSQSDGGAFTTPTALDVPATGSRKRSPRLTVPSDIKLIRSRPFKGVFH